jgi:hypothetical protein
MLKTINNLICCKVYKQILKKPGRPRNREEIGLLMLGGARNSKKSNKPKYVKLITLLMLRGARNSKKKNLPEYVKLIVLLMQNDVIDLVKKNEILSEKWKMKPELVNQERHRFNRIEIICELAAIHSKN